MNQNKTINTAINNGNSIFFSPYKRSVTRKKNMTQYEENKTQNINQVTVLMGLTCWILRLNSAQRYNSNGIVYTFTDKNGVLSQLSDLSYKCLVSTFLVVSALQLYHQKNLQILWYENSTYGLLLLQPLNPTGCSGIIM